MTHGRTQPRAVAIIGGGITGLAAAYHLQMRLGAAGRPFDYILLEKDQRPGGTIRTDRISGYTIEGGPDCFLTEKPQAMDLCAELGIRDRLLPTNPASTKAFILWKGKLHGLPEGVILMIPTRIIPFFLSTLISVPGKIRMGMEIFIPKRTSTSDESLASFVRRRFGEEALIKIGEPLVAGVHAGDPETMSVRSTFPRFLEMEGKYGSLIKAMIARRKSASRSERGHQAMFMTFKDGLEEMVGALVRRIPGGWIRYGASVISMRRDPRGYQVNLSDGSVLHASAVILSTPAHSASDILRDMAPELSRLCGKIPYVSTATVSLGYLRKDIRHSLNGFGFLVPHAEGRKIMGCTWTSSKFSLRSSPDRVLLRFFIGGVHGSAYLRQDDPSLVSMVREEARAIMGIDAGPDIVKIYRWDNAMPQYVLGHEDLITSMGHETARWPGLFLAGSAYRGGGIPECIADGRRAAQAAVDFLTSGNRTP